MDLGEGFLSPPAAPQADVSRPVLDLNGPKVFPTAGFPMAALSKDENDQGNTLKVADAAAVNGLAPAQFNLSPNQTLKAPAGVSGPPTSHPEPSIKVSIHICLRIAFYVSLPFVGIANF
jgi:hypothetical protein